MFKNSVVLRNEERLLAIVSLVGLVLWLKLLVNVASELLEKHMLVERLKELLFNLLLIDREGRLIYLSS